MFPNILTFYEYECNLRLMDYKVILKNQLRKRQEANSKYSLRAFAKMLELSPSKLSEVLSGKKKLSLTRIETLSLKLGLSDKERALFILSAQLESSSKNLDKDELKQQIQSLSHQINAGKTAQRNAWYFGAIDALENSGFDSQKYKESLEITDLQIENAKRFRKRIRQFYPDRSEFSFEPISILKKIESKCFAESNNPIESDFVFLTEEQANEFKNKVKGLLKVIKSKNKGKSPKDLSMVYWGNLSLL
ncbi:MAG: hypothetical protein R3B45_18125 [Bdellovibrionota bacterium]